MESPLGLSEIYSPGFFTTICNTCLVRFNFITYDNVKDASSKAQIKNSYQKKFLHVLIFFFFRIENANVEHIICSECMFPGNFLRMKNFTSLSSPSLFTTAWAESRSMKKDRFSEKSQKTRNL